MRVHFGKPKIPPPPSAKISVLIGDWFLQVCVIMKLLISHSCQCSRRVEGGGGGESVDAMTKILNLKIIFRAIAGTPD